FLSRPSAKSIDFSWDRMLDKNYNPGWILASAWSKSAAGVMAADNPDESCGMVSQPLYRFAVIQSAQFDRVLRLTVTTYDISALLQYLVHLASWYLSINGTPSIHRVIRAIMHAGLSAIGCFDSADKIVRSTSTNYSASPRRD